MSNISALATRSSELQNSLMPPQAKWHFGFGELRALLEAWGGFVSRCCGHLVPKNFSCGLPMKIRGTEDLFLTSVQFLQCNCTNGIFVRNSYFGKLFKLADNRPSYAKRVFEEIEGKICKINHSKLDFEPVLEWFKLNVSCVLWTWTCMGICLSNAREAREAGNQAPVCARWALVTSCCKSGMQYTPLRATSVGLPVLLARSWLWKAVPHQQWVAERGGGIHILIGLLCEALLGGPRIIKLGLLAWLQKSWASRINSFKFIISYYSTGLLVNNPPDYWILIPGLSVHNPVRGVLRR